MRKPCVKFFCMAFSVDFFKKMRSKLLTLYIYNVVGINFTVFREIPACFAVFLKKQKE